MRVYPVVHYLTDEIAIENARIAAEKGADGLFLISMNGRDGPLPALGRRIKDMYPQMAVGINLLSQEADRAIDMAASHGLDMAWTDYCGIHSNGVGGLAARCAAAQTRAGAGFRFFAGVAFKYQRHDPNPPLAAQLALQHGFVPTTSGEGTGQAADMEKLAAIRAYLPKGAPLAVASGVTPENAAAHADYVTDVLVATGISVDDHHFDPARLAALMTVARLQRGVA